MKSRIENEKDAIISLLSNGKTLKEIAKIYGYARTNAFKESAIKCGILPKKDGTYYEKPKYYKCKYCGKKFNTIQELGGHTTFCDCGPYREKNLSNLTENRKNIDYNTKTEKNAFKCQFCGKEIHRKGCLVLHEISCPKNPNRIPRKVSTKGKSHTAWNKGKNAEQDYRILRGALNRKKTISNEEYDKSILSHKKTNEEKRKLRERTIAYIKENGNGSFGQRFSVKGCKYADMLNEENGWHLQHALNGGEYEVCGYFLDGYDKELNIAFEYDEPKHYENVFTNELKKRDIERQTIIKEYLNCKFYRYNEKLDLFYEV